MPLTLNQFLLLVITFAVVVAVTFLVMLFIQLRRTARDGEGTLAEIRSLAESLRETSYKVNAKIDDLDGMLEATKKTAIGLSEITWFMTTKIIRPSSKFWPFLFPFIRLGWRQMKKKRREKNE
jgi:type VI protein secretion system component VasK